MQVAARIDDPMFRNYAETPGGGGMCGNYAETPPGLVYIVSWCLSQSLVANLSRRLRRIQPVFPANSQ